MGRLVDVEDVKALINGLDSLPWEEETDDLVDTIPTAYNVDEVVKEVKEISMKWLGEVRTCNVIRAIRKGGVDEEYKKPGGSTT